MGKTDIEDALRRLEKLTQEEVRMATAQVPKIVGEVKSSLSRNPNPGYSSILNNLQRTSGDGIFESGSHLPIHPQATLSCAALGTREAQSGSSEAKLLEVWKSTGSLLWIHGKRTLSNPSPFRSLTRTSQISRRNI